HHALAARGAPVKASVLCPGWVRTRIAESDRNRPAGLRNPPPAAPPSPDPQRVALGEAMRQALQAGIAPDAVADCGYTTIRAERFYVTEPRAPWAPWLQQRMDDIMQRRNPVPMTPSVLVDLVEASRAR